MPGQIDLSKPATTWREGGKTYLGYFCQECGKSTVLTEGMFIDRHASRTMVCEKCNPAENLSTPPPA